MPWRRLGLIHTPKGDREWARSHAALPAAISLDQEHVRIFFSSRDAHNRSHVGYVDLAMGEIPRVIAEGQQVVLTPPAPGQFDSDGIGLGSIVRTDTEDRLYYMGWSLCRTSPWRNSLGMAIGDAAKPGFRRAFDGPVVPLTIEDPFTLSYPQVLCCGPGDWRMWYGSNLEWGAEGTPFRHCIKLKRSPDGIDWSQPGIFVLPLEKPEETVVIRPSVLVENGRYRMWFSTRGAHYRIGAAVSQDGENWTRCDEEAGLDVSADGWDSEMVCYPCVIDHNGRRFLFYNGNDYGWQGFGAAVWED